MAVEKKFVQEGFKKAMIDEFFLEKLERAGYGGMDINRTPMGTQITIRAEKPGMIIGKAGKSIRRYTKDLDMRFKMDNPQIDVQEVKRPELNAQMMASRLANALERGWYFRKAGQSTLQRIMDSGAMGVEIVIAGKLTGPEEEDREVRRGLHQALRQAGRRAGRRRLRPGEEEAWHHRREGKDHAARSAAPGQDPDTAPAGRPRRRQRAAGDDSCRRPEAEAPKAVPATAETTAQEVEKIIADSHAAEAAAPKAAEKPAARARPPRARRPPRKEGEAKPAPKPAEPTAEPAAAPVAAPEEPKAEEPKRDE